MLLCSSARVRRSEPPVWKQQERSRLICKSRVYHANAQVLKCTLNSRPANSMTHQRRRSAWLTAEFSILLSDSLSPSHPASISKGNNNLATIYMRSLILWLKALGEAQTHCFTSFKSMYQLDSGCKTFNDVLQTVIIIMLRIMHLKTTKSINAITMFHNS